MDLGRDITSAGGSKVTEKLAEIASDAAFLDGQEIQDSWFPLVEADVMLSHSHRNEDDVLMLAGWLHEQFGITAFVDSVIWGYAGTLLKLIDNEFCYQPESKTYSYERRNESTSHVHMLLTTALGMMSHKTECLIFVNTPASIAAQDVVTAKTFSPWIYAELTMAAIVEEVVPPRLRIERRLIEAKASHKEASEIERLSILHTIRDMSRLRKINCSTLRTWDNECEWKGTVSLDKLYEVAAREKEDGRYE